MVQERDGIDGYNESIWQNLGHKAFENDYTVSLDESLEWWNTLEHE